MNIAKVIIESGAIKKLPAILNESSITGPLLLVADNHTYRVAGEAVGRLLVSSGFQLRESILNRREALIPDEKALGEILAATDPGIVALVSVGSGSITDLTRYTAYQLGKPFIAVATAPSMDGYASPVAALTINGYKRTMNAKPPVAIIADLDILSKAPPEMIRSGFGDLLGKYTSLADWKLSSLITGEGYSEEIAAGVREMVDKTVAGFQGEITGVETIRNLTQGLIVSGEAMLEWGNSRPASGAEHHLAHFWEMQAALAGRKCRLHGIKVGAATVLVVEIYQRVFGLEMTELKKRIALYRSEPKADYIARIHKAYGPLAGDVLASLQESYLDPEKRIARQERILVNWEEMRSWVKTNLPTSAQVKKILHEIGAPVLASNIGVNRMLLGRSLMNAKEIRDRYTVFRLAEDIAYIIP
jgi:glycerol-1-phosphate dehydrogenase [NAD(P)+]